MSGQTQEQQRGGIVQKFSSIIKPVMTRDSIMALYWKIN